MNLDQPNRHQQQTWAAGDFSRMGVELAIAGELLCETIPVYAGDRLLDVATASGNTALAAARRRAQVTGIDLVAALLDHARRRAFAEGLEIDFQVGNAMALPFADGSFDIVTSTFGAIFAPDPDRTSAEMARVCRPGGKIALAVWTPDGMLGKLFRLLGSYAPAVLALASPVEWGEESTFRRRLDPYGQIVVHPRTVRFRARSPEHWVEFMRTYFGPAIEAFDASTAAAQLALADRMSALAQEFNVADNGTVLAQSDYLELVVTRRR
jgi:ubiquinone/menaquinone biosynthesis C-methylase UbiE